MNGTLLQTPPRTILEVFESLPEGTRCEVVNNTLVMSPAPSDTHQKVLGKIFSKLLLYAEDNNLGEVRISPYDVYFDEENIFQPDLIFILNENASGFFGTPDLIVEVLSTSNAGFDKKEKKDIYEKFGVTEYFIIDPFEKFVTGFALANKKFVSLESNTGIIHSKAFGFTIRF
jgi:Uma2 family endonuclease